MSKVSKVSTRQTIINKHREATKSITALCKWANDETANGGKIVLNTYLSEKDSVCKLTTLSNKGKVLDYATILDDSIVKGTKTANGGLWFYSTVNDKDGNKVKRTIFTTNLLFAIIKHYDEIEELHPAFLVAKAEAKAKAKAEAKKTK